MLRELLFKTRHLVSQDELGTFQHTGNGRVDFRLDAAVLGFEINKWNHAYSFSHANSIGLPRWLMESVAASRIFTTRMPAWPSVRGRFPFTMQSRKCAASVRRASVLSN